MSIQENDYVIVKKEANMKVLQVTLNKYATFNSGNRNSEHAQTGRSLQNVQGHR